MQHFKSVNWRFRFFDVTNRLFVNKRKGVSENYQPLISFVSLFSSSGDETNVFVDAVTEDARKNKIRKLKFIVL